jgi:signal transduction histidine kinase
VTVQAGPAASDRRGVPLSLRVRETLALVAVVVLVVGIATVAHLTSVAQLTIRAAADEGALFTRQLFHQSARVLATTRTPSPARLGDDPGIRALLEGMVGYSRVVVYAALVDPAGRVIVHSDPTQEGTTYRARPSIDELLASGSLRLAWVLLTASQILETTLPLQLEGQPFAVVRAGVSTSLVRQELRAALVRSLALGLVALAIALAVGLGAGRVLFESVRRLARRLEHLARRDDGSGGELSRADEMGQLADHVNRLGEQIQAHLGNGAALPAVESLVSYSQKLAALGRLTSGVAHEVKNPLNAMRIHLELLRTRLGDPPPGVAENLDVIVQEIQRLDRVVQGFLRFMRPQDLHLEPVDLNALLADVARLAGPEAARSGVDIALGLDPGLPTFTGDAELLQQTCANLVTNAIQAMPKGGALTLTTRTIRGSGAPDAVAVEVQDEGVGIAPEDVDKIFRLYYTTKEGGSGIGLSLVYRIVQLHDGRIAVASTPGQGTTVTIELPLARGGTVPS